MRFGCYFMGASGTGKSALADAVAKDLHLPMVPSVARTTMKALGYGDDDESVAKLLKDRKSYGEFQKSLYRKQIEAEEQHVQFVADRGCDHLAYSSLYADVVKEVYERDEVKAYLDKLAGRQEGFKACVFLVRPTQECHEAALEQGKRSPFLIWEDMLRIDGMIEMILKIHGIRYVPISTPDFRDRFYTATSVADLARPKPPAPATKKPWIPPHLLSHAQAMQKWLSENKMTAASFKLYELHTTYKESPLAKLKLRAEDNSEIVTYLKELEEQG